MKIILLKLSNIVTSKKKKKKNVVNSFIGILENVIFNNIEK